MKANFTWTVAKPFLEYLKTFMSIKLELMTKGNTCINQNHSYSIHTKADNCYLKAKKALLNMKNIFAILGICLIILSNTHAQKEDNIWMLGAFDSSYDVDYDSTIYGRYAFDFSDIDMKIVFNDSFKMDMDRTTTTISDSEGNLIAYSNGMHIMGSNHQDIPGGEIISYGSLWEAQYFTDYPAPGINTRNGFHLTQANLMLPWPDRDSVLYINTLLEYDSLQTYIVQYSIIDLHFPINATTHKPKVVAKDIELKKGWFKEGVITACRHANGRDWWIIIVSKSGKDFYTYLFDPSGIHLEGIQSLGFDQGTKYHTWGQAYFSPDGSHYALLDGIYIDLNRTALSIFDFDRCTGLFSNRRSDVYESENFEGDIGKGLCFSPNNRYLYSNNYKEIYQYDMEATDIIASKQLIAEYDGFKSYYRPNDENATIPTLFGYWATAPDGKLYHVFGGSSLWMHRMNYPNEGGEAADFQQHAFRIKSSFGSIPNLPHYRLGPLDGSSCDTLGLDNHAMAKYRYEADSLDYLKIRFTDLSYYRPETWAWTFGDGSTSTAQSPYHHYSSPGTYEVCLTVSNENGSNTTCRSLVIGPDALEQAPKIAPEVALFPNPTQGELLLTLSDYIPQHGIVTFYDNQGKPMHHSRIFYGWNNVDITALPNGVYSYRVMDGGKQIGEGKVVKTGN